MEIRKSVLLGFLSLSLYISALPNHLFTFQENGIWSPDKNTPAMRLARDISRNYNQQVRPVIDDQTFTKVEHLYILHQIVYLDSKEQRLKALYFEVWVWTDEFIRWDPKSYGNITDITLSRDQVWIPDIVVYNELGNNYNYFMKENLIPVNVNYQGVVKCETPLMLETICLLDISDFPFDQQECKIKVGSWSQPSHKIHMSFLLELWPEGIDTSDYTENSEWDLKSTAASHIYKEYPGTNDTFSELEYSIVLKRRTPFYEKNLIVPTILTSMMSVLVFLLPPESGEKISLAITVFLALSLNMLVISDHIPVNSLQVPIISQYSLFSLGTITVSLWSSIMVINIHGFPDALQVCEIKMAPPKIVRLCRKLWPYISYSHGQEQQQHPSPSFGKNRSTVDDQTPVYCNGRSRMKFEMNNVISNEAMTSPLLPGKLNGMTNGQLPRTPLSPRLLLPASQWTPSQSCKQPRCSPCKTIPVALPPATLYSQETDSHTTSCRCDNSSHSIPSSNLSYCSHDVTTLEHLVKKIADLARAMSDFVLQDEKSSKGTDFHTTCSSEWTLIANCVDRIFAIFFFIINVTVTIGFFIPYYLT